MIKFNDTEDTFLSFIEDDDGEKVYSQKHVRLYSLDFVTFTYYF
jgi:t-SNARE complex subunit (syntaxin)